MRLLRIPGMYRPQADTWLLVAAFLDEGLHSAEDVLDVGTGTGAVAMAVADTGARHRVTAVDISRRAVWVARANSLRRRRGVAVRCGDLFTPVATRRFDVVLANPPYVPSPVAHVPRRGPAQAWDGGNDGRVVLDRICQGVRKILRPGGTALIVHSELCDTPRTMRLLASEGLRPKVVARRRQPFGPVLKTRVRYLEDAGLVQPGCCEEELVVVRADNPE